MDIAFPLEMTEFLNVLEFDRMYSNNTIQSYKRNLKQFVSWLDANDIAADIFKITPPIIRKYVSFLKGTLKGISIKQKIATLKSLYNYYQEMDESLVSPSFPQKIKAASRPVQTLTAHQLGKLIDAPQHRCDDLSVLPQTPRRICQMNNCVRDRAILTLLVGTGVRVSELTSIDMYDIDWNQHTILIRGKGGRERIVYFGIPILAEALEQYNERRLEQDLQHNAFFVNSKDNNRLTPRSVQRMLKLYLEMTGLPVWVSPHILRHSFATVSIENGANIKAVSQLLGHVRVDTTIRYYLHLSHEFVRKVYIAVNPFAESQLSVGDIITRQKSMVLQI